MGMRYIELAGEAQGEKYVIKALVQSGLDNVQLLP